MNIIILTEEDRLKDDIFAINDERLSHILQILKLKEGDTLETGLLNGLKGKSRIKSINDNKALIELIETYEDKSKPAKIELVCALPRPQTLKKVLSACSAMGISKISLIRSHKVEKSYFQSPLINEKNYRKYLIEGLSQGKQTIMPEIGIYTRFKNYFKKDFENNDCIRLLANPYAENYLNGSIKSHKNIIVAIGPEAGWNDFEINYFKDFGFVDFRLSESILRVENAVVAVLAQIELLINN